jgi:spore coat polysaccharide biosynthesis protein SpsF
LKSISCIDEIVLGISEGSDNEVFKEIATREKIRYIVGDQIDVLSRLIECGRIADATDIFRTTSESPFLYFEPVGDLWMQHQNDNADATFLDDIIDGCNFEIITLDALRESHSKGSNRHRSELCTLYLREHRDDFKIIKVQPPKGLIRRDLRLTVDNPEDLIVCRAVYRQFEHQAPNIKIDDIVRFLDDNPDLKALIYPFTEPGT